MVENSPEFHNRYVCTSMRRYIEVINSLESPASWITVPVIGLCLNFFLADPLYFQQHCPIFSCLYSVVQKLPPHISFEIGVLRNFAIFIGGGETLVS